MEATLNRDGERSEAEGMDCFLAEPDGLAEGETLWLLAMTGHSLTEALGGLRASLGSARSVRCARRVIVCSSTNKKPRTMPGLQALRSSVEISTWRRLARPNQTYSSHRHAQFALEF